MEKKTVAQAKKLFENPFLVLPSFDDTDSKKAFKKMKKQLEKVEHVKYDTKKLEKFSKKRNLAGAVAGTLLIAHAEKAPFLAAAKLPTGQITYAQRGTASKEHLIAAQYVDDPFLRVLGIRDVALKYDLHIYSWDDGFVSTGKKANPPADFVSFVIDKADFSLKDSFAGCSHLSKDFVKNEKIIDQPYIHIIWKSAGISIGICKSCAKKKNTLFSMTKYLIEPDVAEDFEISVIGEIIKGNDESGVSSFFVDEYLMGKLSDHQLIEKNMKKRKQQYTTTSGLELATSCAKIASDAKAEELIVLDVEGISSFADYFVIMSGRSTRHVQGIAESIENALCSKRIKPSHTEGLREGMWVLLDFDDVVVHIFYYDQRSFYNLEGLWHDAKKVALPEE